MEKFKLLEVVHPDILSLSNEEFMLVRKNGLGASDASVFLGLMTQWKKVNDLIEEKCRDYMTPEEAAVGELDSVRKGRDLEPTILKKAEEAMNRSILKPKEMYRIKEYPYLTISFDGVTEENGQAIPVEAKYVTKYGEKYYNTNANEADLANWDKAYSTEKKASICGIPAYYYAQVQQQILGLGSSYGYLAALHELNWKLKIYKIPRDEVLISKIIIEGHSTWNTIKARKAGK